MNHFKIFLFTALSILVSISVPIWGATAAAAPFGSIQVGLEFEYAGQGHAADNSDRKNYKALLHKVQHQFGGNSIAILPWNKFSNSQDTFYASFQDGMRREWQVVPEQMNSKHFDGYELITPPLNSEQDGVLLERVLAEIEKSGMFINGRSSSTHFTFDVSHLIEANGNAARLVDLILFLESNMPSIYNAVGPERYGQVVNKFAVPLGINQKELLQELASLPRRERTFSRAREIFEKYHDKEMHLLNNYLARAWKFRAVNYGKLFGLGNFKSGMIPVVEVRIADLADSKTVVKVAEFLTSTIDVGANTPMSRFQDPYPTDLQFKLDSPSHKQLNRFIKEIQPETYLRFIRHLGLPSAMYPSRYMTSARKCELLFLPTSAQLRSNN